MIKNKIINIGILKTPNEQPPFNE